VSDLRVPAIAVDIHRLSVALPDGRRLFDEASLSVEQGELVVLVGRSGSGKTTLLRLICGLRELNEDGLEISGRVSVTDGSGSGDGPLRVGVVFQGHALFDELTALGNVQFALDHREERAGFSRSTAADLLQLLGVPIPGRLHELSGGERQRVAVARTLAQNPSVLLFDEPTAGLDPGRARIVADRIADTHRQDKRTTIVVTHDYSPYVAHKPRFILLDGATGRLLNVSPAEIDDHFKLGDAEEDRRPIERKAKQSGLAASALAWIDWPGAVLITLLGGATAVIGGWRRPKWRLRYLWHYLRMAAIGVTAVYVAIAGVLLGFVFIFFSFAQLPYKEVMVPLLTEEFLSATGYSMFRVLVPLLVCVLIAGKCGAALAADVGVRRLTHQFEALRSFGVDPRHYLYGNALLALIIGVPVLCTVALAVNWYAALVAFLLTSSKASITVFERNFLATTWPRGQGLPAGAGWVLLKAAVSGVVIAALAYALGSRPKSSSVDVGKDVGLTIFWASLGVLMVHSLFSFVEF